jgi:hypothetical protein
MGKNQSASNLTNIIKQDASGNITFVSGSTTLMSVSSSGAITTTGNVAGTASYASNAELLDGLDSTVFTLTSSFAAQTASFTAFTSSVNSFSASIFSYTASQNILNGTYATTGSNTFKNPQTINSNLTVTGSITAATLVVQTITSSIVYSSGSNIFGNNIANSQTFTGSVSITGSQTTYGNLLNPNSNFQTYGSASFGVSTWGLSIGNGNASANYYRANDHYFQNGAGTQTLQIASTGAATFSSTGQFGGDLTLNSSAINTQVGLLLKDNGTTKWQIYKSTANDFRIYRQGSANDALVISTSDAATFSSSVTATIFDSTSNAFRFNGSNALSLVTLNSQSVVKINAAGYWGTQLVGANDQGILISNTGNVGIGTSSPSGPLHLSYSSAVYDGMFFTDTRATSSSGTWRIGAGTGGVGFGIYSNSLGATPFFISNSTGAATFSSSVFSLRSNIGTGTSDDADITLNVSAPSGVGKYIMFGRNSSNTAVMAIDSDGNIGCVSYNVNSAMNLGGQVLGTVSTSWVSTNLTTLYVGFVFIYWADSNSGERNTAVITCNYYPSGVTVISSSNNGGKGMQFQMNGSTLQLKTTTGTAAGVQLVYWKV